MLLSIALASLAICPLVLSTSTNTLPQDVAHHDVEPGARYITLPLQQKPTKSPLRNRYSKIPIFSEEPGWSYLVNITIGSNNQTIPVIFDTGSSYSWVNPDCSTAPDEKMKASCLAKPRYDPFASTNAKILDASFNLTQFGVVAASRDCEAGLLGVNGRRDMPPSPIGNLALQGKINSNAFSVDMRSMNETGSIIIGGIDTKKYKCSLTRFEGGVSNTHLSDFGLTLPNGTSITFDLTPWTANNSQELPIYLDTGTPTNLLPFGIYSQISSLYPDTVNHTTQDGYDVINVPCDAPLGTFDYTFGNNTTIKVSFQDSLYHYPDGTCTFGFTPHPGNSLGFYVPYILANSFMCGAYTVFDIDNGELWMGQSADCGTDVVPIGKGRDAVPVVSGCGCEVEPTSSVSVTAPCSTAMATGASVLAIPTAT